MKKAIRMVMGMVVITAVIAFAASCATRDAPLRADINPAVIVNALMARVASAEASISTLKNQTSTWASASSAAISATSRCATLEGQTSTWATASANGADWAAAKALGITRSFTNGLGTASTSTVDVTSGLITGQTTAPAP